MLQEAVDSCKRAEQRASVPRYLALASTAPIQYQPSLDSPKDVMVHLVFVHGAHEGFRWLCYAQSYS